jgi:acyl dehydratase
MPGISKRRFNSDDQIIFSRFSGDYNEVHLDEIAARRSLFGTIVVHGVHLLLWSLDTWLERFDTPVKLISLKVSFKRPLLVGEIVKYRLISDENNRINIELYEGEQKYVVIKGDWQFADTRDQEIINSGFPDRRACRDLTTEDMLHASGEIELCVERKTARDLFPNLVRNLALIDISQILATTRLVGMECPGLNSIFSGLDIKFGDSRPESPVLRYKVIEFDDRFSSLMIEVEGPSMKGTVKAFARPEPKRQKSFSDISRIVSPDEFKSQCALIIGGSRGLGEVTSKLLSAGGAHIILTYFRGFDDAHHIADEIISGGAKADIMNFNVLAPNKTHIDKAKTDSLTHVYYFATPHIKANTGAFSTKLFRSFCDYYVSGFSDTLNFFCTHAPGIHKVFYPSSVFIDTLPWGLNEYGAAKAAGESLCSFLEKYGKELSIYRPRLPRMATDQTVSIVPDDSIDPVHIMVEQLREFRIYSK